MLKLRIERFWASLALTMVVWGSVVGASSAEAEGNVVSLRARVLDSGLSTVSPFNLVVSVQNESETLLLNLQEIVVELPMTMVQANLLGDQASVRMEVGEDLDHGASIEKVIPVRLSRPEPSPTDSNWGWLFIHGGEYSLRVEARYRGEDSIDQAFAIDVPVRFEPPLTALVLGALLGALLIISLRAWTGLVAAHQDKTLTWRSAGEYLVVLLALRLPLAMLLAVLAILLARVSTEFSGVLQVELNHFWAGWLVGVLAQSSTGPVAESLGKLR